MRNGQPSAVALDIIALMDALKIEQPILAGFDWGARTANIIAALWPERCKAMVSVSGYLIVTFPMAICAPNSEACAPIESRIGFSILSASIRATVSTAIAEG